VIFLVKPGGFTLIAILMVVMTVSGCASLQEGIGDVMESDAGAGELEESVVIEGIREALRVGTGNTLVSTSRVDGYLGNEMIRIALPDQLKSVASTLRSVGLGAHVDELEVGMNRAAELAAAEARDIFWEAITKMTIADAFGVLNGDDTAATEYFRGQTGSELRRRFHPIIESKMEEIGLSRLYGRIEDTYSSLTFTGTPELVVLDEYVTDRALEGLFTVLAGEEKKIRRDPAARTTELLRQVFGK
jgi:hypothetical protein